MNWIVLYTRVTEFILKRDQCLACVLLFYPTPTGWPSAAIVFDDGLRLTGVIWFLLCYRSRVPPPPLIFKIAPPALAGKGRCDLKINAAFRGTPPPPFWGGV